MAQPHPQPNHQRPSFSQHPSYQQQFQPQNGQPRSQFSPQSPQMGLPYSSPSPQQPFSPPFGQAPPAKRQRLSPEAPSPFSQPVGTPQASSPVNPSQVNGVNREMSAIGSMPPPQRPIEKEDRDFDDVLKGAGVNLDDEFKNLSGGFFGSNEPGSFQSGQSNFDSFSNGSFARPGSSGGIGGSITEGSQSQISPEERQLREQQRQDWEAARHAQHELWDPFLYGATLNDKLKSLSQKANLVDPQSGVLVNTQKNAPPPTVRVNGLEGATRVINNGQSILDTREKAERLNELVKLLSLSAKARLTGLLAASARLALERREHSNGRIPDDWEDVAVPSKSVGVEGEESSNPTGGSAMKRSFSQANSEASTQSKAAVPLHPSVTAFERLITGAQSAEDARRSRRDRRKSAVTARESESGLIEQDALVAAALDPDKKTTKKERKAAESKISERQQHASTNEAARMATAGLLGRLGGKKSKSYSWMTGGGSAPTSTPGTPSRPSGTPSVAPNREKPAVRKGRPFNQWDEERDPGIQARDVLLVLETDGKAARSFVKASSSMDEQNASI